MIQSTRGGQGAQGTGAETVEVIQEEVAPTAVPAIEDDEAEVEAVTERTRNKVKTVTRVRNNAGSAVVPASTTLLASGSPGVFRAVAAVPSFGHEFLAAGPQLAVGPGPFRNALLQRGPLGYSLAGDVSRGFYSYPGRGVAYEF